MHRLWPVVLSDTSSSDPIRQKAILTAATTYFKCQIQNQTF